MMKGRRILAIVRGGGRKREREREKGDGWDGERGGKKRVQYSGVWVNLLQKSLLFFPFSLFFRTHVY